MKYKNKGFTLAELLIVVAIIAVLVAISIPIFSEELEKGREATDAANIRSEYAEMMSEVVSGAYDYSKDKDKYVVDLKQTGDDWTTTFDFPSNSEEIGTPSKGGKATLYYKNDKAYIDYGNPSDDDITPTETPDVEYNTTLISGFDFNSIVPSSATSIVFTKSTVPDSATNTIDLSSTGDGGVIGYLDGTTFYVSPKKAGATIYAPESCYGMFAIIGIENIDFTNFDTSNVTDMMFMFADVNVKNLDLSIFDTSKVTNMYGMFENSSIETVNLSSFDTSNVTNMEEFFYECYDLKSIIGLNKFNTSKVTTMKRMFDYCGANELDVSSFDTSNVTDMSEMFSKSYATNDINLSSFDTSKVTNMNQMFAYSKFKSIDCSSFNTSNVTDMDEMFYGSDAYYADISSFDFTNVTTYGMMFYSTTNYNKIKVGVGYDGKKAGFGTRDEWAYNYWKNSAGEVFYAWNIPSGVADTYTRVNN